MKYSWKTRTASLMLAAALAAGLPVNAFAETYYLEDGDVKITSDDSGQYVKQEGVTNKENSGDDETKGHKETSETVIKSNDADTSDDSSDKKGKVTIEAKENSTAEVTFKDVTIDKSSDSSAAVEVTTESNAKVKIELEGDNSVKSGTGHAGIETSGSGKLVIQDTDGDGKLEAAGGEGGAGIGGGSGQNGSNIEITGGTVTATGGQKAAGIGGGAGGDGTDITVSGGTVTANAGAWAAGIGGGSYDDSTQNGGDGTNITISGGTVYAKGVDDSTAKIGNETHGGAGIGGGHGSRNGSHGNGTNITITNATVYATAGHGAAGIGGGDGWGSGETITITNSTVEATGADGGAGIGGGFNGSTTAGVGGNGKDITITDSTVTATGSCSNWYNLTDAAAGIGGGYGGNAEDITVSGGTVTAKAGGSNAAAIGGGQKGAVSGTVSLLDRAKVLLGYANESDTGAGYIGDGATATASEAAQYVVDCTATIAGTGDTSTANVESTYRQSTSTWLWDKIKTYIHYTPATSEDDIVVDMAEDGSGTFTNGNLTIRCTEVVVPEPEQVNTGVIASTDPAAQRWYWVTALLGAEQDPAYTYEQTGSCLTVTADSDAVLHVLLSGWAEHTEVQQIVFVTPGKTTTLQAAKVLTQASGEQLTLTHEYDKATLAVDGTDHTALLGEAVA